MEFFVIINIIMYKKSSFFVRFFNVHFRHHNEVCWLVFIVLKSLWSSCAYYQSLCLSFFLPKLKRKLPFSIEMFGNFPRFFFLELVFPWKYFFLKFIFGNFFTKLILHLHSNTEPRTWVRGALKIEKLLLLPLICQLKLFPVPSLLKWQLFIRPDYRRWFEI